MPLEKKRELDKLMNPRYIYRDESRSIEGILCGDPKLFIALHDDFYAWYEELKASHKVTDLEFFGLLKGTVSNSINRYNVRHNDNINPINSGIMSFSGIEDILNQPINKVIDKLMVCFFKTAFDTCAFDRKLLFDKMLDAHILNKSASKVELEILKRKHNLE